MQRLSVHIPSLPNDNARIVYAVGQKGTVLKSTNDGVSWEKKELNIGANQDLK